MSLLPNCFEFFYGRVAEILPLAKIIVVLILCGAVKLKAQVYMFIVQLPWSIFWVKIATMKTTKIPKIL